MKQRKTVDKEIKGKFKDRPTEKQMKIYETMVQSLLKICVLIKHVKML